MTVTAAPGGAQLRAAARKYTKNNPLPSTSPERVRIRQECEAKVGSPCDKANVPVKQYQNFSSDAKDEPDGPGSPMSIFVKDLDQDVDETPNPYCASSSVKPTLLRYACGDRSRSRRANLKLSLPLSPRG